MDSNQTLQTLDENHRTTIKSWFDAVISNGGVERYDDLHVDQIDDAWASKQLWISAALQSFEIALEIRDNGAQGERFLILLAIDLHGNTQPLGVNFCDQHQLEENLSYIPPSLYVLRPGMEFWKQWKESEMIDEATQTEINALYATALFGQIRNGCECFFTETLRPGDEEYSRYLYLAG